MTLVSSRTGAHLRMAVALVACGIACTVAVANSLYDMVRGAPDHTVRGAPDDMAPGAPDDIVR